MTAVAVVIVDLTEEAATPGGLNEQVSRNETLMCVLLTVFVV